MGKKPKGAAPERLSITWSNTHQELFNKALTEALEHDRLTVTIDGKFQLSRDFFDQKSTKGFLDRIPRHMLEDMIAAWIGKRTGKKLGSQRHDERC